jgi:hypothetical protein
VRSKALVVAYAVHETGRREVIGIDIGEVESEAFWVERSAGALSGTVRLLNVNEAYGGVGPDAGSGSPKWTKKQ